ncbi:MAG: DUF1318 domain-containing protein [Myxococcaceae bacterium]|jgi:hypothetical protein|nr:DUF1318 domain-containing protein [Myxococcaceae bacterium]MCA3013317.1 DUF1318 domain-containing protein [Myxococcaceae bacterium]
MKTFCLSLALALSGCIKPPDVVMVDRQTMLEEQVSGELEALDQELREQALVPTSADFSRGQLEAAGVDLGDDTLTQVTRVHAVLVSELELIDELLVRRCLGEATTGLLEETPATCSGRHTAQHTTASVHRVNRARRQLWDFLARKGAPGTLDDVARAWRREHLEGVVCGAQVQAASGAWEVKRC